MKILIPAILALGLSAGLAFADGDAAKGEKIFNKCKACHTAEEATNKTGPHLMAVVGRKVASIEGYKYSDDMLALGAAGTVWDEANLDRYLTHPKEMVPKGKMAFAGLKKPDERANLIAYLKTK